jgi:nucleoside 2-deoxyribosyltransferase
MRIYIAGKLSDKVERDRVEKLDALCNELGFDTFLPHRDVGLVKNVSDAPRIFKEDITTGLAKCNAVLVSLEGLHIGSGTAWELGYAYAHKMPIIGIKTDESIEDALDYLSPIIIASTKIVTSIDALKKELNKLKSIK